MESPGSWVTVSGIAVCAAQVVPGLTRILYTMPRLEGYLLKYWNIGLYTARVVYITHTRSQNGVCIGVAAGVRLTYCCCHIQHKLFKLQFWLCIWMIKRIGLTHVKQVQALVLALSYVLQILLLSLLPGICHLVADYQYYLVTILLYSSCLPLSSFSLVFPLCLPLMSLTLSISLF